LPLVFHEIEPRSLQIRATDALADPNWWRLGTCHWGTGWCKWCGSHDQTECLRRNAKWKLTNRCKSRASLSIMLPSASPIPHRGIRQVQWIPIPSSQCPLPTTHYATPNTHPCAAASSCPTSARCPQCRRTWGSARWSTELMRTRNQIKTCQKSRRPRPPTKTWNPPHEVKPVFFWGGSYSAICWSDRRSYMRAVWSSEQEANPRPLGWYWNGGNKDIYVGNYVKYKLN